MRRRLNFCGGQQRFELEEAAVEGLVLSDIGSQVCDREVPCFGQNATACGVLVEDHRDSLRVCDVGTNATATLHDGKTVLMDVFFECDYIM